MSKSSKITRQLILLIVLLFGVYFVYSNYYDGGMTHTYSNDRMGSNSSSDVVYIEVEGEKEISSKRTIVNDRFVGKLDKDGTIIAISSNGEAYNVRSGVVLASDMVVSSDSEIYSIYRIKEPVKSVSTN